jgi:hypothetical protein
LSSGGFELLDRFDDRRNQIVIAHVIGALLVVFADNEGQAVGGSGKHCTPKIGYNLAEESHSNYGKGWSSKVKKEIPDNLSEKSEKNVYYDDGHRYSCKECGCRDYQLCYDPQHIVKKGNHSIQIEETEYCVDWLPIRQNAECPSLERSPLHSSHDQWLQDEAVKKSR